MKALSDQTAATVVSLLICDRETLVKRIAYFIQRVDQLTAEGHPLDTVSDGLKCTQKLLDGNSDALRDLSKQAIPWIKEHPDLKSVFEQTQQATTNTQEN